MENTNSVLGKNNLVRLGTVSAVVVFLGGGIMWLTTMYNDISYLKREVDKTQQMVSEQVGEIKANVNGQLVDIKSDIKEIKSLILEAKINKP